MTMGSLGMKQILGREPQRLFSGQHRLQPPRHVRDHPGARRSIVDYAPPAAASRHAYAPTSGECATIWRMKRLLGSVLIGCAVALFPVVMARAFAGQWHRLMIILTFFMVDLPGTLIVFVASGGNGSPDSMTVTRRVVASCALYSAAAYAVASLRSRFRNADASSG
jgi:hypothetical protein